MGGTYQDMDVVGCGALNMDYIYQVDRILQDGEGIVQGVKASPGGSAANTVYALARLGLRTGFVGAVGDDEEGRAMVQELESVGIDTTCIKVKPTARSGSVLSIADRKGNRALYVSPGANDLLTKKDIESVLAQRAGFLHLSSFVGRKQMLLQVYLVESLGMPTRVSLAPGMLYARRGLDALAPLLRHTHVLFLNQDEMNTLTDRETEAGAAVCHRHGAAIVVVTLGKGVRRGDGVAVAYVYDGNIGTYVTPADTTPVAMAEGTGAGDAFAAGFLFGLAGGRDLRMCGLLGDTVARFSLRGVGAREGLPSLAQLRQAFHGL
ncbi:MAG: PfkB family carbohydrate kinase [Chloroflexota bacterium]